MTTVINKSKLLSLAHAFSKSDPVLYRILKDVIDAQDGIVRDVEDIIRQAETDRIADRVAPPKPANFVVVATSRNIVLSWDNPDIETVASFDVRKGTDWDSADRLLTTPTTRVVLDPITVGDHTYMVRSVSTFGVKSKTSTTAAITIPAISDLVVRGRSIDNTVLLDWETPVSTFDIAYYTVRKGIEDLGRTLSTFHTIVEVSGGTFIYDVVPVDIAGNVGADFCVEIVVSNPRDYIAGGTIEDALDGVIVNGIVNQERLITPVKAGVTWQERFAVHNTLQALIDVGYEYWLEPSATSGTYENVYDFIEIYNNRLVSFRFNFVPLIGEVAVAVELSYSEDNVTFTAPLAQLQLFADSVRYVKVKLTFTPVNSALIAITRMINYLEVRLITEQGRASVLAADANGTVIIFEEDFLQVSSVVGTVETESPRHVVVSDIGINSFSLWVFDDEGDRQSHTVDWIARGSA